ncbi:sensor histidine kinase [Sediminicoccus rosea]|uniref:histidine kinase n=1 Tax=Sediminicoccus rosea TaxID=1225128 RepID=A0ABZ0PJA2_9PROT|nr:ATP-binding protein [Sediminicoccus rosea]WPB85804.1 ATP-binding protein [Sediminicoccus rosea]
MALLALLPLLLLAGFAITEAVRAYRKAEEVRLRDTAALVAAAVDARMAAYSAAMTTLSLAPSLLRDDDHASFHRRGLAVAQLLGGEVLLLGEPPDFELHAASDVPLTSPLPVHPRPEERATLLRAAGRAAVERRPVISDLFLNYSGEQSLAVVAPVLSGDHLVFLVVFRFRPENLLAAITPLARGAGEFVAVTDSQGRILMHTRGAEGPPLATPSPPEVIASTVGRQSGVTVGARVDGRLTTFAYERLAHAPGWIVFVGRTRVGQAEATSTMLGWVLAALAALASALGLLALAHRREALRLARQEAAALRAGRDQIERLLGGLPAVIFLRDIDPDGGVRLLYRAGDIPTVTGWPAETLRDQDDWSPLYPPGVSSRSFFAEVMREGSGTTDWQMIQPDGSLRAMRTHARRLTHRPDGGGEMVGYVLNVEAELRAAARAAAAGRLSSLGEMAAGIAHELKQPLQSVSLLAENALISAARGEAVTERLDRIIEQVAHAADIIENLRRFARGTPEGEAARPVDLAHVVRQTLALADAALREASVRVEVDLGQPSPLVMGHAVGIEQTLLNLLINARDAMRALPPGAARRIRIGAERLEDGRVALSVADTGGGIPPAVLARIFEPFVTTKGPETGTGLGLSISHGLIRAMGGTIEARNGPEGAVFTVTLPAAAQALRPVKVF